MSEHNTNEMQFQIQRVFTKDISLKRQMHRRFSRKSGNRTLNWIWTLHLLSWLTKFTKWYFV